MGRVSWWRVNFHLLKKRIALGGPFCEPKFVQSWFKIETWRQLK